MLLNSRNEIVDNRPCVDIDMGFSQSYAIMINDDGSYSRVMLNDLEYYDFECLEAIIDANYEQKEVYRKLNIYNLKKGDRVIVAKGNKYPIGTIGEVTSKMFEIKCNYVKVNYVFTTFGKIQVKNLNYF